MKEIGGFFGMELKQGEEYHSSLLHLNTGRNCLEYILRAQKFKKLYLPYYICDAVLEPVHKTGIDLEFYHIDANLDPVFDKDPHEDEGFLYVNYFGIKQKTVERLAARGGNLIIDNSQAFFSRPQNNTDSFYSPRKFFGVPDGGYLFTKRHLEEDFEKDLSYDRMQHLLKRTDLSAKEGYQDFRLTEDALAGRPIKEMSSLTGALLKSFDYTGSKEIREQNFSFLHKVLNTRNLLKIDTDGLHGPMAYPFVTDTPGLKKKLIGNNIYIPDYWSEVLLRVADDSEEAMLSKNLTAIPVDQRYNTDDMEFILNIIQ